MAKFNLLLTGNAINTEAVLIFRDELIRLGASFINLVDNKDQANMEVDISHITGRENLTDEALHVLSTVKGLQKYEGKRNRIIKKFKSKILLASSNLEKMKNRKNIN